MYWCVIGLLLGGLRTGARCRIHVPTTIPMASSTPSDERTNHGMEAVLTNTIITSASMESHAAPRIRMAVFQAGGQQGIRVPGEIAYSSGGRLQGPATSMLRPVSFTNVYLSLCVSTANHAWMALQQSLYVAHLMYHDSDGGDAS